MDFNQMAYFKAVAETGKIVKAADALFVTPSAISASLAQLEKELGVQLFDRSNNRLRLNRQGIIFLHYVESFMSLFDCARNELHESLLEGNNHVAVAVTNSALWIDLNIAFAEKYPQFTMSNTPFTYTDIACGNFNSRFSFLLGAEEELLLAERGELERILLFEDHPAIIVNPSHPLANREFIWLAELLDYQLLWPRIDQFLHRGFTQLFNENHLPKPPINSYSHYACRLMVQNSDLVALSTMRTGQFDQSGLCYIPISDPHQSWRQYLYWRRKRVLSEADIAFRDFVLDFYGVQPNNLKK